jgi:hypothetical protein
MLGSEPPADRGRGCGGEATATESSQCKDQKSGRHAPWGTCRSGAGAVLGGLKPGGCLGPAAAVLLMRL